MPDLDTMSENYQPQMMPDLMITADLSGAGIGNLADNKDYEAFMETPLGEAMYECVKEQMAEYAQGIDGVSGYEPDGLAIQETMYAIQSFQVEEGPGELAYSNDQIIDDYRPGVVERTVEAFTSLFNKVSNALEDQVNPDLDMEGLATEVNRGMDAIANNRDKVEMAMQVDGPGGMR